MDRPNPVQTALVFLAITPSGLHQAIELSKLSPMAIWCGADAISEADWDDLSGVDVSRFDYPLAGETPEVIQGALETIAEHHPQATVWVEHVPSS